MKLQEKISIYYTSLTHTERKICRVILDDPTVVSEHSIIDAATLCGTSKSAMLRFAKKLGYSGYNEFKYAVGESFIKEDKKIRRVVIFIRRLSHLIVKQLLNCLNWIIIPS